MLRSFERSDAEANGAAARGAHTKASRLRIQQIANSQAYYVLLWAQFESGLDGRVSDLATRGKKGRSNRSRRVWELISRRHADNRLSIMEQVELLVDKSSATCSSIQRYYKLRNGFAHGRFQQTPIDLRLVAADLARLYRSIRVGR